MGKEAKKPIPLSTFLSGGNAGPGSPTPASDELPRRPNESSDAPPAGSRRWIAEWDGESELLVSNVLPAAAVAADAADAATSIEAFKIAVDLCLREFLSSGDVKEAARCVDELGAPHFHLHVVKRSVILAMDKAGREREMIAVLLSAFHARGVLTSKDVSDGFGALLEGLDDLLLDIPSAATLVAHFLADAHLDGLVPLSALDVLEKSEKAQGTACREVLKEARGRLVGRVPLGGSQLDKREVRTQLRRVIEEFLSARDVAEVRRRLVELAVPADLQHQMVRAAVELGIERKDHERELVSQLLSELHDSDGFSPPLHLTLPEVARGFEELLARLDDLSIDNPRASEHLAAFMTRAVADEILPPVFLYSPEAGISESQKDCLRNARAPLAAAHFGGKARHVWGAATDGSLEELKKEVAALCDEYLVSGELDEAVRCVEELGTPNYHHELVKRLVGASIIDGGPTELKLAVTLTARLSAAQLLHTEQLALGCTRLLEALPDMRLDRPGAPEVLASFLDSCCEGGYLTPKEEWTAHATRLRAEEKGGKSKEKAEEAVPLE